MAAYAAVVSLMNTMEQIKNHPRFSSSLNKESIESLREILDFLLDFIETYNSHGGSRDEVEALETQIVSAAHAAEDVIESHIASQVVSEENFISYIVEEDAIRSHVMLGNPSTPLDGGVVRFFSRPLRRPFIRTCLVIDPSTLRPFLVGEHANRYRMISDQVLSRSSFSLDQQKRINREVEMTMATLGKERSEVDKLLREKIIQDMDSIKEKVTELRRAERLQDQQQQLHPTSAAPSRPLTTEKTTVVGFDGYLVQLLDWLTGQHPDRQIIPITGMGGIGPEWNPVEGEFRRLIFLGIYGCSHLISWRANASHFPVLKQLVLERLWILEEIPLDIGEIPTLERISVYDCNISAAISAIEIQREQENLGNHDLKVEVGFSARRDLTEFQKKLEEL